MSGKMRGYDGACERFLREPVTLVIARVFPLAREWFSDGARHRVDGGPAVELSPKSERPVRELWADDRQFKTVKELRAYARKRDVPRLPPPPLPSEVARPEWPEAQLRRLRGSDDDEPEFVTWFNDEAEGFIYVRLRAGGLETQLDLAGDPGDSLDYETGRSAPMRACVRGVEAILEIESGSVTPLVGRLIARVRAANPVIAAMEVAIEIGNGKKENT